MTRYAPLPSDSTTEFCRSENLGERVPMSAEKQAVLDQKDRIRDELIIALMLERAARDVAARSESVDACRQVIRDGEALFLRLLQQHRATLARQGDFEPAAYPRILEVQRQITDLWREDQSGRATLMSLPLGDTRDARFWANRLASAHVLRSDRASAVALESLLDSYDWIDRHRFGGPVSAHAWILVQHADDRVELQAEVLGRMEAYLGTGGIRPANYAYLWDRVAINSGRPQRYGTQPIWTCVDGQLELAPIEDRQRADELRQELGMNSVAAQLADMSRAMCESNAN